MRYPIKELRFSTACIIAIITAVFVLAPDTFQTLADQQINEPGLTITTQTNQQTYLLRQRVLIQGTLLLDSNPASDLVVCVQVINPLGVTVAYRTLQVGTPTQSFPINITSVFLVNTANDPIDTVKINTVAQAGISLYNWQLTPRDVYGTITVFDANMVPIASTHFTETIGPYQTTTARYQFDVPKWACSGKALVVGNVYSKEPRTGGLALSLERTLYYCLSRTQQGLIGYAPVPPPPPQNTPGMYKTNITMSPDPRAGSYNVHVVGQASPVVTDIASATFAAEASSGYPPQASFAFWPAKPYQNQTVSFDASSSTPEGFNDTITKYEWTFGDGTPKLVKTDPYATHAFALANTYIVTLNVTDNEGLWSTTSKPLTTLPEFGPTANFTWVPKEPIINQTATFNADGSTTGWCARTQRFSPIQTYKWNFGDGTGDIITASTLINHNFSQPNNYTVKLTVTDADGRFDDVTAIVRVLNMTQKMYDVNGDGSIDLKDVYAVAKAYGSYPGHPKWNPACDFNKDNLVDLKDYYPCCQHYGEDP